MGKWRTLSTETILRLAAVGTIACADSLFQGYPTSRKHNPEVGR